MSKKKINFDVSGMSWSQVIEADITHIKGISDKDFARATSRLVSAVNKRFKRLEQSGLADYSPAYRGAQERGETRLSVKGKERNEIAHVYAQAKRLLTERSTSSLVGTRKMKREITKRIGHEFQSKEESKRFWEAVDKLKEKDIGNDKRTSADTQREVSDMMFKENMSLDDVLEHYGIVMEAQTPDIQEETQNLMTMGYDEDDEDEQDFDTFGDTDF